jgi:regulator of PEP synthase PpsR (kinase-PPPase family)
MFQMFQELFELDQQKCFALQIKPERLREIRGLDVFSLSPMHTPFGDNGSILFH